MNIEIATYLIYLGISIALTIWVAHTLHKNGRIFLVDVFHGNEPLADSVNHLLVVGFYLINLGFVSLTLKLGYALASPKEGIEALSVKIGTVLPKEGSTGWSDTWMVGAKAAHPNCMYKWMNYIISPEANAQVAEYFGEAPSQTKSCALTADKEHCATYHADDAAYAAQIHYWTTPQTKCVDGSGDNCTSYEEWVNKWQEIKG